MATKQTSLLAISWRMYLRFVYARPVDGMRSREGFLQAAGELANDPLTDDETVARINALRLWFAQHLAVPTQFSRGGPNVHYRREAKGLSWFKPSARQHIAKAFELKFILDDLGYAIDVLKEKRIGYVVFEDDHQIVAEPFSETVR